jgi:soluble lytic murein transglycosylase
MQRKAALLLLVGASAAAAIASQTTRPGGYRPAPSGSSYPAPNSVATSIALWNALRQSDSLPFSSYATFLVGHRGWPGEAAMRRTAEQKLARETVSPHEVLRFFDALPPTSANGHAQQALALLATGRADEARAAARRGWTAGAMTAETEQRLLAQFGGAFTPEDHDRRLEVLLGNGDSQSAARAMMWAPPHKRALMGARLALQTRAADAASRVAALDPAARRDPGLILDQANWLRNTGQAAAARQMLASSGPLARPPVGVERWLDTGLTLARAAANDRQWSTVYGIASKLDQLYAPGTDVSGRPYAERDDYTSLAWLGGTAALFRLNRPADAARLFQLYGSAARSPQTRAKGFYWAARAAAAAGQTQQAGAWLEQAAANPDQFYGQLALERLGRTASPPPAAMPIDPAERGAFAQRPLAQAIRYLGTTGRRGDQTVFIRALAEQLANERERALAGDFGRSIGRLDMGVWAAREARTSGESFYARSAFPDVPIPPAYSRNWAFAHGIMRQESSFDRSAISSAGARGMMQLMPATARQAAGRVGVPYSLERLTEDPAYNVLLGNYHLQLLLDEWGGNAVLVAAAYNAGSGNVRRWVRENGDPRSPGADVVRWIEEIPFSETRNYVQRVLENMMVYDLINPNRNGAPMRHRISTYLGQPQRG